jgi:SAM-dependent methyltransferase
VVHVRAALGMDNLYQDEDRMRRAVSEGRHREIVGGMWNEIGALQFEFLKAHGLQPQHTVLDLGCGSGRLAAKAVPYLQSDCYYGIDISPALLAAAQQEIIAAGYGERLSDRTFYAAANFEPSAEMPPFDFSIAQSLFTHLPLSQFTIALNGIRRSLKPSGRFFATFFIAPAGIQVLAHEPGGVVSYLDRDPFHFAVDDILGAARTAGWCAQWIGGWAHPRDQQMCELWPKR